MNPLFARNRISDYLDGELSPAELSQFEDALEKSQELQIELERMRESIRLFKQHGPSEAPLDMMSAILDRLDDPIEALDAQSPPPSLNHRFVWPSLAVAAVCLILLIPEAPVAPQQVNMGGILEVTSPNAIELPVNMPSAYDLLSPQVPQTQQPTIDNAPKSTSSKVTTQPKSASSRTKIPKVTFIPETPYVPEWETDSPTIEIRHNQNEFYAIGFATSNVLFALESLANRYSGRLLDASKQPLSPYDLDNETNFARVYIEVPLQHWTATDESLRHLGSDSRHPMVMSGEENVMFTVEVTFNP